MTRTGSAGLSDPSSPLPMSRQPPAGLLSPRASGLSPRAADGNPEPGPLESRRSEIEPAKEASSKQLPHRNRMEALQDRIRLLEKELIDIENTNKLRSASLDWQEAIHTSASVAV